MPCYGPGQYEHDEELGKETIRKTRGYLCETLRALERHAPADFKIFLAANPEIAIWKKQHDEEDAKKIAEEAARQEKERLLNQAREKLTPEERAALGLKG